MPRHLGLLALCVIALAGCRQEPSQTPPASTRPSVRVLRGQGQLCFAPIGGMPASEVNALASEIGGKLSVPITVLPARRPPEDAWDVSRQQGVAEVLVADLQGAARESKGAGPVTVIGITRADIYTRDRPDWRYCFGILRDRFGVVSMARMDPAASGGAADSALTHTRLRKLVTKYVGVLYFHLQTNDDPSSVLYGSVGGPDDLDRMGEDF